jgi:hypothetical protein
MFPIQTKVSHIPDPELRREFRRTSITIWLAGFAIVACRALDLIGHYCR